MSRGGRREGAGRPASNRISLNVRLSKNVAERLRLSAKAARLSIGEVVELALSQQGFLDKISEHPSKGF